MINIECERRHKGIWQIGSCNNQ